MSLRDFSALRNRAPAWLATIAATIATILLASVEAQAAIVNFAATVNQAQETPPTGSASVWSGTFVMDTDANTLSVNVVDTLAGPLLGPEIAAHIHGFAPPGVPAGILFGLPLGSPKIAVWNFTEPQQASIIAGLSYVNIHTTMFPAGEIRGQILRVPSCGDGVLDGGETCDDGNTDNGDCCSSLCQVEALDSPCSGGCGQCDGAGTCEVEPRGDCRTAVKSIILLKNDATDSKDKLLYKWIKGAATLQSEFGTPTGTTNYSLCIYTGSAQALLTGAEIAADSLKWAPISDKGYKYKDTTGGSDGIQKVILKGGDAGKSKALVKGKGANLPDYSLGTGLELPVVAELVNSANNVCFGSTFDTPDVIKNDAAQFKAKAQ